jgi:hypothetical protein
MSSDPKLSEWNLLLDEFQARVREGSDSIEDIFDVQFRLRFSKLLDQAVEVNWRWDNRGQ